MMDSFVSNAIQLKCTLMTNQYTDDQAFLTDFNDLLSLNKVDTSLKQMLLPRLT